MNELDTARELVREGDHKKAFSIIENILKGQLADTESAPVRNLFNAVIISRARQHRIDTEFLQGTISNQDFDVAQSKVVFSLLKIIDELERTTRARLPEIKPIATSHGSFEKLMGPDSQLRSIGWLAEGLRLSSSICRLTDGQFFGSGFLCRPDIIVTNNHLISSRDEAKKFRAEFHYEEDFRGQLNDVVAVGLDPDKLFCTCGNLDITVVALARAKIRDVLPINLKSDIIPKIGDRVSIIQHPSGGPKQMAVTNNRVANINNIYLQYMTDTLPGSSGSPVFDERWRVVAVHHAGGNMIKNDRGDKIFANEGILIDSILRSKEFNFIGIDSV